MTRWVCFSYAIVAIVSHAAGVRVFFWTPARGILLGFCCVAHLYGRSFVQLSCNINKPVNDYAITTGLL